MNDKLAVRLFTYEGLHEVCKKVEKIDDEIFEIVSKMILCMKLNHGLGLSANQVGIQKQICVVSLENNTKQMALVNPKITHVSKKKKVRGTEGCLSAPRVFMPRKRFKEIIVECLDLTGKEQKYHVTDMDARILQHEIDHLRGRMITDTLASPR